MAGLLGGVVGFIKCLALWAVGALLAGITTLVNLLIAGLMALLGPLLGLLPTLTFPELTFPSFLAWCNWVFPMDQFVAATALVLSLLGVWHVVAVGLRWLKVVE